jgi:hypothetical protein
VYCLYIIGPAIFDYNKRLILLSVIPLSGGHCISIVRFLRLKVFLNRYHYRFMLSTMKIIKYLFLCVIASQIHPKVTKSLIICGMKFSEFRLHLKKKFFRFIKFLIN